MSVTLKNSTVECRWYITEMVMIYMGIKWRQYLNIFHYVNPMVMKVYFNESVCEWKTKNAYWITIYTEEGWWHRAGQKNTINDILSQLGQMNIEFAFCSHFQQQYSIFARLPTAWPLLYMISLPINTQLFFHMLNSFISHFFSYSFISELYNVSFSL